MNSVIFSTLIVPTYPMLMLERKSPITNSPHILLSRNFVVADGYSDGDAQSVTN